MLKGISTGERKYPNVSFPICVHLANGPLIRIPYKGMSNILNSICTIPYTLHNSLIIIQGFIDQSLLL